MPSRTVSRNKENTDNISYLLSQMSTYELRNLDRMLIDVGNSSYCQKSSRNLRLYMQNIDAAYKRPTSGNKRKTFS